MPCDTNTFAAVSINKLPANRQSWPITTLKLFSKFFLIQSPVAVVILATFSTVNSSAIMALQPSVPNLISDIL